MATSPEASKRAFLEKKGLTPAEIADAFTRVPQPPPALPAPPPPLQPPASSSATGTVGGATTYLPVTALPPQPEGLRWTQLIIRVGLAGAAASYLNRKLSNGGFYRYLGLGGGGSGGSGGGTSASAAAAAAAAADTAAAAAAAAAAVDAATAVAALEAAKAAAAAEARAAEVAQAVSLGP